MRELRAIRVVPDTKISHDYDGDNVDTWDYSQLISNGTPAIGIPCIQNRIFVVDIDVMNDQHKHDGREWWSRFTMEAGIPKTYTVRTRSGGFHYYFNLPASIREDQFHPPKSLDPGVDIKYRGWVIAPPSPGYEAIHGTFDDIIDAPPSLMLEIQRRINSDERRTFDGPMTIEIHAPFTERQVEELRKAMVWWQKEGAPSRSEWLNGIFAIHAGCVGNPELEEELITKFTYNKSFVPGDLELALQYAKDSNATGAIGPGTIFNIIKETQKMERALEVNDNPFKFQDVFLRAGIDADLSGKYPKFEANETNVAHIMEVIFEKDDLYYDARSDQYVYRGKVSSDVDILNSVMPILQSTKTGLGCQKIRKQAISAAIDIVLHERRRDPHMEFLKSVKWDGVNRIGKFFIDYVGVPDNAYHRLVSKNFWVSMAARGLWPGCKFDSMVVLEGKEGIYKSSLVNAIGGEYTYAPNSKNAFNDLDELRQMHQSVIVELPELMGLIGESEEKVKSFLSKPFDHIRTPYAKKGVKNKRGFILVGTTNVDKYLTHGLGIRRFWPIKIPDKAGVIKLEDIKRDREQLFAEAIVCANDGCEYWEMPRELLSDVVKQKVMADPFVEALNKLFPHDDSIGFSVIDIYKYLEKDGMVSRGFTRPVNNRIEGALKEMGMENREGMWYRTPGLNVEELEELV